MNSDLQILDMSGARPEHSTVIVNFVSAIREHNLDYDENQEAQYYLWKTVTEENKDELKIVHFPKIQITFDKLFAEVDLD